MAVGSTPRDSGNIPLGCVLVPGDTTPQALQGGAEFTDANGNISAPLRAEVTPSTKKTYSAAWAANAGVTGVNLIIPGNATNLVKVMYISIIGTITTTAIITEVALVKYSTAYTGGTTVAAPTFTQLDSNNGAPVSNPVTFSVAPTAGTAAGIIRQTKYAGIVTSAIAPTPQIVWNFSLEEMTQPPTLHGVAQAVGVTMTGTITGTWDFAISWTEE